MSVARIADAIQPRTSGYLTAAAGLTAIIVGVFLLMLPGVTTVLVITFLAVYWLIGGAVKIVKSLMHRSVSWAWDVGGGILSVIAGAVVLANVAVGAVVSVELLFVGVALAGMTAGVIQFVSGLRIRSWGQMLIGVAEFALALLLLAHPAFGMQAVIWLFGVAAICVGFTWMIAGFQRLSRR